MFDEGKMQIKSGPLKHRPIYYTLYMTDCLKDKCSKFNLAMRVH